MFFAFMLFFQILKNFTTIFVFAKIALENKIGWNQAQSRLLLHKKFVIGPGRESNPGFLRGKRAL